MPRLPSIKRDPEEGRADTNGADKDHSRSNGGPGLGDDDDDEDEGGFDLARYVVWAVSFLFSFFGGTRLTVPQGFPAYWLVPSPAEQHRESERNHVLNI